MPRAVWKGAVLAESDETVVDGKTNPDAAWYYARPSIVVRRIAGHVAFWQGVRVEGPGSPDA